ALFNGAEAYADGENQSKARLDSECAYPMYHFAITDAEKTTSESFADIDAETTAVSELLTNIYDDGTTRYIFADTDKSYRYGELYLYSDGQYHFTNALLGAEQRLFFNPAELAVIINDNEMGMPESIKYVYTFDDDENYMTIGTRECVILIETEAGEYAVTDITYTDDVLSNYLVLTGAELIEYFKGDLSAYYEKAYNNVEVQTVPEFSDIDSDSSVGLLARLGIIDGYEDGTFGGENYVTRAEAAKMIALAYDKNYLFAANDTPVNSKNEITEEFSDIDDHWARKYIRFGVKEGYISGNETAECINTATEYDAESGAYYDKEYTYTRAVGEFRPDDTVTERELAKMIICAAGDSNIAIAEAEGGWYEGYVAAAKRFGICESAEDVPATRLTAAHMIRNMLDADVMLGTMYISGSSSVYAEETLYVPTAFYEAHGGKRLVGTITAASDTDSSLRENEIKMTLTENSLDSIPIYRAGDEVTLVAEYADVKNYVGKECVVYADIISGTPVAVMAE
ncbi:MAG: S-layer homology domain-containing protein, partial [Firmicutes bacterium]|nr:S-layer homology domain-containing protein [Bacillota bacterium]